MKEEKEGKEEASEKTESDPPKPTKVPKKIDVEEFFVKYRSLSYLHCEWRTEEELLKGDKRITGKIKRYKQKRATTSNLLEFVSIILALEYLPVSHLD